MSQLGIKESTDLGLLGGLSDLGLPLRGGSDPHASQPPEAITPPSFVFPQHYLWLVALALLDIVLTALVLENGGRELNAVARFAIEHAGIFGMVAIKASTLLVIFSICEYVGRRQPTVGRRIVEFALAANSVAVACGLMYLAQFTVALLQIVD